MTICNILIGNSFPLSLIRRSVRIVPVPAEELRAELEHGVIHSFWGHENSRIEAERFCGVSLRPAEERPALTLSAYGLPVLDGIEFQTCFVLSPDYRSGFRPAIASEVPTEALLGWQCLKLQW